ncbi:MAG: kdpE [Schlesneria sp.]|nr:kdpE [Schlesneria sp.]
MPSDPPLILVVEDDAALRRVTCAMLGAGHYRVIEASSGQQALAEVAAHHPDAILLDLGLPDMDGLEVMRQISDLPMPPIVVFSARGIEEDKVAAFDAGAIDYLAKPFVASELLTRMHSALSRPISPTPDKSAAPNTSDTSIYQVGELTVDPDRLEVSLHGKPVSLTQIEWRLLLVMIWNRGKVVTNRQFAKAVWGPDSESECLRLRIYIGQLRRKLESDPTRPRYLKTESGIDYRLADV